MDKNKKKELSENRKLWNQIIERKECYPAATFRDLLYIMKFGPRGLSIKARKEMFFDDFHPDDICRDRETGWMLSVQRPVAATGPMFCTQGAGTQNPSPFPPLSVTNVDVKEDRCIRLKNKTMVKNKMQELSENRKLWNQIIERKECYPAARFRAFLYIMKFGPRGLSIKARKEMFFDDFHPDDICRDVETGWTLSVQPPSTQNPSPFPPLSVTNVDVKEDLTSSSVNFSPGDDQDECKPCEDDMDECIDLLLSDSPLGHGVARSAHDVAVKSDCMDQDNVNESNDIDISLRMDSSNDPLCVGGNANNQGFGTQTASVQVHTNGHARLDDIFATGARLQSVEGVDYIGVTAKAANTAGAGPRSGSNQCTKETVQGGRLCAGMQAHIDNTLEVAEKASREDKAVSPIEHQNDHDKMDEEEMEKCAGKLVKQRKMVGGRVKVHPNDVICRKGTCNNHGNFYIRELINERGYLFQASTNMKERQEIICEIVDLIYAQDPPGRFLTAHKKGIYQVATQETVELKIRFGLHQSRGLRKSRSPPMASDNANDATAPDAPTSTTIFVPRNNSNNSKKRESPKEPPAGQAPSKRRKSASNSVIAFEQQKSQPIMKPGPTDVLCVKDQPKTHRCPGEKYLRDLIRKYRDKYYHTADPTKRGKIRAKIENLIQNQSPPGRFLDLDKTTKTYHVASDERISQKLNNALIRRDNMQRSFKKMPPPQQQSTSRDQGTRIRRPPIHATLASQRHFITVNSRVSILWVSLNAYFPGTIEEIILPPNAADTTADDDGASSICYYNIRYDDDTTEMVDLMRRKFKILQLAKQEEESGEGDDDDDRKPAAI